MAKKTKSPVEQLAELIYYHENKNPEIPFEGLPLDEKDNLARRAINFFEMIDKMNMVVAPKVEVKDAFDTRIHNVDMIEDIIKEFLKGVTKPKGVAEMFPTRNLAFKIVDGR